MAGTLPNIALIQQRDNADAIMRGCLLYIYPSGTVTRATAYKDIGLTAGNEHPWPVPADSTGRVPYFYLADGNYRARLASADGGYVAFDVDPVATTVASTLSGSPPTINISAWATGKFDYQPVSGTQDGWVRANARTIGSATSGATERANADTQALFQFLYTTYADSICPVSGGRGASSAADWAANKQIGTPDFRFVIPIGLDDMGNTSAGRASGVPVVSGSATAALSILGEPTHVTTVAEMPAHNHGGATGDETAPHTHSITGAGTTTVNNGSGGSITVLNGSGSTVSGGTKATALAISSQGGGGAHNNTPRVVTGTWYIKL